MNHLHAVVYWVFILTGTLRAAGPLDAAGEAAARGGFAACIECVDPRILVALGQKGTFLVDALYADPAQAAAARKLVAEKGLRSRVSVNPLPAPGLPYADDMVNLLVLGTAGAVPAGEIDRVLAPLGTVLTAGEGRWNKKVAPWPEKMDRWTHYLRDASGNPVSSDELVAPPLNQLRWRCGPRWSRSHETDMSLSALVSDAGRIFYILDEGPAGIYDTRGGEEYRFSEKWSLAGRDAFSGVLLWKRPMGRWGSGAWDRDRWRFDKFNQLWSSPYTLPRRLVAAGDRLYVTLDYRGPLSEIDAATGETLREIPGTGNTEEIVFHDGILLLRLRGVATGAGKGDAVAAIEAASGKLLWKIDRPAIAALTLAAAGDLVCFHDTAALVGVALRTGEQRWRTACKPDMAWKKPSGSLSICGDTVLLAGRGQVRAFSAADGRQRWQSRVRNSFRGLPDVIAINGAVWLDHRFTGLDIKTGKPAREITPGHLFTGGHHFRCYRSKATERYLLFSKRGIEFLDLAGDRHAQHDWVRGTCRYGIMPANGMVYAPPDPCFCYPGVKLDGFNALASGQETTRAVAENTAGRLEKGPAFASAGELVAAGELSWPTYRGDPARSGATDTPVPARLKEAWTVKTADGLTPPVVAGGRLLVAAPDSRLVYCLDAADGNPVWTFEAGGPVDSPPTIFRAGDGADGRLLCVFGCCDGTVYCLRLADGALAWRFRAAPRERTIVSFGRLESSWPVRGSVLVTGGVAYLAAGRSSFLDGGIGLYGLDAATGAVLHRARLAGPRPDLQNPSARAHEMDGSKNDILVAEGGYLFLYQNVFDMKLNRVAAPKTAKHGARKTPLHLVASGGFLDDTWFDRTYWLYARRWPGQYVAVNASKAGQILVFDEETTYGLHVFNTKFSRSPRFEPGGGYELFADDNDNEPFLEKKQANHERGVMSRSKPAKWTVNVPVRARAMVLAGPTLFFAGPPDEVKTDDPLATFAGRGEAALWAVAAADGKKLAEQRLASVPVFDGMIAAGGRLYICTTEGSITCLAGE